MNDLQPNAIPPQPPAKDQTHRQIPGYQMLEKLGAGAMAVVFKARQLSLDRLVAIKVLPKKLSADEDYVARFYQEGQAAAKLNHPNIVQAIDVSENGGYHYFVMEYVEGKTVYDELQTGKVYSESEALGIILQVARAMEHAHAQGLIHRDVKPKNIMITESGVAKLMDMGLARVADDVKAIQTESGRLYGTPYYISPEQITGKSDIDFRCDIYALGATLYHMVTGKVPFDGKDAKSVMVKHLKQPLVAPDRYNMDLSFGLVKVIQKMMAKKRKNRYSSTGALLEDLQSIDFLLEVETPSEQSAPMPALKQHVEKPTPPPKPKHARSPARSGLISDMPPPPVLIPPRTNKILLVGLVLSVALNLVLLVLLLLRG